MLWVVGKGEGRCREVWKSVLRCGERRRDVWGCEKVLAVGEGVGKCAWV